MDPHELAGGWLHGFDDEPMPPDRGPSPRAVLEEALRGCLLRSPCVIGFSGGRDSSALLAVAVHVARRDGLSMPTPLILRYRDAPGSEESEWQQLVLDHLGIRDPVVISVGDEHDAIGPIAAPVLERHGVFWPPNFSPTWRMMDIARGGVLVTGEGGDELLGVRRITPVSNMLRALKARRRPHPLLYPLVRDALAPAPLRRRAEARNRYVRPWLRPPVEALLTQRMDADQLAFSLHAGHQTWQFANHCGVRRMIDSMRALGSELDVDFRTPLLEPGFASALAHALGPWGSRGRTHTMTQLFNDVLPPAVLDRNTKAHFTHGVFTEHTRAFARQWDGTGLDGTLIDPEILRKCWLTEPAPLPAMGLLQEAWLASQRSAPVSTGI